MQPALEREGFALSTRVLEGSNYMASYADVDAFTRLCGRYLEVLEVLPSRQSGETQGWAVLRKPA